MTSEQLMEERYILQKLWPGCLWSVGAIFPGNYFDFQSFSHLFRKLEWWEERNEKDLPSYVKGQATQRIVKVKEYDLEGGWIEFIDGFGVSKNYLPATEEEYLAQQGKGALAD